MKASTERGMWFIVKVGLVLVGGLWAYNNVLPKLSQAFAQSAGGAAPATQPGPAPATQPAPPAPASVSPLPTLGLTSSFAGLTDVLTGFFNGLSGASKKVIMENPLTPGLWWPVTAGYVSPADVAAQLPAGAQYGPYEPLWRPPTTTPVTRNGKTVGYHI